MAGSDIIKDTKWVLAFYDGKECRDVSDILAAAGATNITEAADSLELLLVAEKEKGLAIIAEAGIGPVDLASVLSRISLRDRYATKAVVARDWSGAPGKEIMETCDVFVASPVNEKALIPTITLDIARKRRLEAIDRELGESEESFAKEKNYGFAKQLIMDKLGLSEEGAGEYILSVGERYGYGPDDVAKIVYEVLLAGDKKKNHHL